MKIPECLKNEKVLYFIGGAAVAFVGTKIVKSDKTRKACVSGLAKCIKIQKDAQATFQNMKEDAQDLCYDAAVEAEDNE